MLRGWMAGCIIAMPLAVQAQTTGGTEVRSTRSGVYTLSQSAKGAEIYALSCASCHPAVTHSGPAFANKWQGHALSELFLFMTQEMPKQDPGILSPQEYTLVLAYMLKMNGMPAGGIELPNDPAALARIRIDFKPGRDTSSR